MPRHTHPAARANHSRGHLRHQRERYIARRQRLAKALYADEWALLRNRPLGTVSAERYQARHLFGLSRLDEPRAIWSQPGRLTRNPFTLCSCPLCSWSKRAEPRRAIELRRWRREELG